MKSEIIRAAGFLFMMGVCYLAGVTAAELQDMDRKQSVEVSGKMSLKEAEVRDWGLGFSEPGKPPKGTADAGELKQQQAYFLGNTEEKKIYLTFDAGYENGNTEPILDALKKHQAKATFFVVGHYLETAPEIVRRMVEEGHTVGNHTWHHYDPVKNSDPDIFREEMQLVEKKFLEITGKELTKYYRPPQGKYSVRNLQMAKELGYHTFFWSLAYVDWNQEAQPKREEALEKLMGRLHQGAIVLLHSTSSTNAQIMDELLTRWEKEGYSFGTLDELIESSEN